MTPEEYKLAVSGVAQYELLEKQIKAIEKAKEQLRSTQDLRLSKEIRDTFINLQRMIGWSGFSENDCAGFLTYSLEAQIKYLKDKQAQIP